MLSLQYSHVDNAVPQGFSFEFNKSFLCFLLALNRTGNSETPVFITKHSSKDKMKYFRVAKRFRRG